MKLTQILNEIRIIAPSRVLLNLLIPDDSIAKTITELIKGNEVDDYFLEDVGVEIKPINIDKTYEANVSFSSADPRFVIDIKGVVNRNYLNELAEELKRAGIEHELYKNGIAIYFKKIPDHFKYISINGDRL